MMIGSDVKHTQHFRHATHGWSVYRNVKNSFLSVTRGIRRTMLSHFSPRVTGAVESAGSNAKLGNFLHHFAPVGSAQQRISVLGYYLRNTKWSFIFTFYFIVYINWNTHLQKYHLCLFLRINRSFAAETDSKSCWFWLSHMNTRTDRGVIFQWNE